METSNFIYIEVKTFEDDTVVMRLDVSNESERGITRIENGLNINLNHSEYYTEKNSSNTKLITGDL